MNIYKLYFLYKIAVYKHLPTNKQGASATVTPVGVAFRRKLTKRTVRRAEACAPGVAITPQEATASTVRTVTIETATTTSATRGRANVRPNFY